MPCLAKISKARLGGTFARLPMASNSLHHFRVSYSLIGQDFGYSPFRASLVYHPHQRVLCTHLVLRGVEPF